MQRPTFAVGLAVAFVLAGTGRAEDFEIDCKVFRGDPKGTKEAGTKTQVALPRLELKSGEEGSATVGSQVQFDGRFVRVGRKVEVSARMVTNAIQVEAKFFVREVLGPNNARYLSEAGVRTSTIVQPGGTVKVELPGDDAKNKQWVEITVRNAK
jgi:hypothetical protein